MTQLHVAIIGGGIGGLFAANALIAHGLRVSVYEQAQALGEIGAGVFLTPNSVRHLQRLGLEDAVEKFGARVGKDSHYFRHDGAPIAPVQVTDSSGWNATFGMHRADLVALLSDALPAGTVHTGHRCTGFEQTDGMARVTFANGASARGRYRHRGGRHPFRASSSRVPAVAAGVPRLRRLSGPGAARAHSALADRPLADVARHRKALPRLSGARRNDHQLCRVRAGGRGDEGVVVGPRRSRRPAPRVRRLGPAHRGPVAARADDVPLGAL